MESVAPTGWHGPVGGAMLALPDVHAAAVPPIHEVNGLSVERA